MAPTMQDSRIFDKWELLQCVINTHQTVAAQFIVQPRAMNRAATIGASYE